MKYVMQFGFLCAFYYLGDLVSRLTRLRAAAVVIHQRVMRGPEILAEAEVTAALVAPDGRPRRQPADWAVAYEKLIWNGE